MIPKHIHVMSSLRQLCTEHIVNIGLGAHPDLSPVADDVAAEKKRLMIMMLEVELNRKFRIMRAHLDLYNNPSDRLRSHNAHCHCEGT